MGTSCSGRVSGENITDNKREKGGTKTVGKKGRGLRVRSLRKEGAEGENSPTVC